MKIEIDDICYTREFIQERVRLNPMDKNIEMSICSYGGFVEDAVMAYNYLRSLPSEYTVSQTIQGQCHSAAIIVLLAAPPENRKATKASSMLIHEVRMGIIGDVSAKDAREMQEALEYDRNRIADIYADRTNLTKLDALLRMNEEKMIGTEEMIALGFVSGIVPYTQNCLRIASTNYAPAAARNRGRAEEDRENKLNNTIKMKIKFAKAHEGRKEGEVIQIADASTIYYSDWIAAGIVHVVDEKAKEDKKKNN